MSQRLYAALLAASAALRAGRGRGRAAAALRHLQPRPDRRRARREGRRGDHPGQRPPDLPRRRPAADDHRLRHPARRPGHAARGDGRLARATSEAIYPYDAIYRRRRDRRGLRTGVGGADGLLAGRGHRGRAARAGLRRDAGRRGRSTSPRAPRPTASSRCATCSSRIGDTPIVKPQDVVDAVDRGPAGRADRRSSVAARRQDVDRRRSPRRRSTAARGSGILPGPASTSRST